MPTKRKSYSVLLVLPALLVLIFILLPGINVLIISLKEYKPLRGMLNSPWNGLKNYAYLFSSPTMGMILRNSIVIKVISFAVAAVFGVIGIVVAPSIPKGVGRGIFFSIFTIIACLPWQLGYDWMFASQPPIAFESLLPWYLVIMAPKAAMAVVFCGGVSCLTEKRNSTFLKFSGILMLLLATIFSLLSENAELLQMIAPMFRESLSVFSAEIYITGLQQMNFSQASAMWVTKGLIQLLLGFIVAIIMMLLFKKQNNQNEIAPQQTIKNKGVNSSLIFIIVGAVVAIVGVAVASSNSQALGATIITVLTIPAIIIAMAVIIVPLGMNSANGKTPILAVLCFALTGFTANYIANLIWFGRSSIGTMLLGIVLGALAFEVLGYICYLCYVGGKKAIPYVVALSAVILAQAISNGTNQINIREIHRFPLPLFIRQTIMSFAQTDNTLSTLIGVLVLICIGIAIAGVGPLFAEKEQATENQFTDSW